MNAARSLDSAKGGHTDVQNNNIRLKFLGTAHALQPVGSLAYDLESRLAPQNRTDLLAEHLMIIDHQNS